MRGLSNISRLWVKVNVSSGASGDKAGTQRRIFQKSLCHFSIKQNFLTLSSLAVNKPREMDSFLKQGALHPYMDGAVSARSRKVSFLVSEAVPCVHFNSRNPCLTLPPPDLGQTSGDHSEQKWLPTSPLAQADGRQKLRLTWQNMKVKEDGSTGVSGIVTTHMEGQDSVWMEKTGILKLMGRRLRLQGVKYEVQPSEQSLCKS